ncbi:MAG: class I mannose-6-phosphate isomerase [Clostridia bacterium]|nr:class I mannose-6-phosphate isomerase [Clostridia bacterium]
MSFMFHPYPYADPAAVNKINVPNSVKEELTAGILNVAKKISALFDGGVKSIGIDAYPGAEYETLVNVLKQQLANKNVEFVDACDILLPSEVITAKVKPYLPEDREVDPVLLYGRRYTEGYFGLQDQAKVAALVEKIGKADRIIVYGKGALSEAIQDCFDIKIWMDVTPRTAVLNCKNGKNRNIGLTEELPYALMMRRNYYVDFETAMEQRWKMMKARKIDYYISADVPEKMQMLPFSVLLDLFHELNRRPFRCRPVYLEGVWGGYYVHRLRNLPKEMKNCAWVFDMIPLEVSLVADLGNSEFEVPFFTFVQVMGEELLGHKAFTEFGGYFPIRFNYDDTFHSSGNMSIQCHPGEEYVVSNHGEFGRQDESYYVVIADQGAKTFLGFNEPDSCEKFFAEAEKVEKSHEIMDYEKYINYVPSVPGTQVMIPAGTIHASGRNQVILEIGSLTVGSYTYKLYDYQRLDITTGLPRPIHLKMGKDVIRGERDKNWVEANLVNHGGVVREGDGFKEIVVGEHDLLYFSLRNLIFDREITDVTNGLFHVLALVNGERVRVESVNDPSLYYDMNYLDMAVIPANFGEYRIKNLGVGTVTIHKTHLKA